VAGLSESMAMNVAAQVELDGQYRALREEAGFLDRSQRGKLLVRGPDAAEFLQGQLTNDIEALEPESGCYAALLDRKGHMQADMRVLRLSTGDLWIDTEAEAFGAVERHLRMYSIGREVEIEDASGEWTLLSVIGPAARETSGAGPLTGEHAQRGYSRDGVEILAVGTDLGVDLIARAHQTGELKRLLASAEAVDVTEAAAEIIRVESGRPRFGREMTTATIPQEAGIDERAVSFTKGCYIGQETVARLHYKGKPNRHLRGLRLSVAVPPGTALTLGEREVGTLGSSVVSPRHGAIGLALIRREASPGDELAAGEATATVVELPF
jgi:tRNA-modifying protein YgfZ